MNRIIPLSLWQNEDFGLLPIRARLLFLGFIVNADDSGMIAYIIGDIRHEIFPHDNIADEEIDRLIGLVCSTPLALDRGEYIQIQDWENYFFDFDPARINEWVKLKKIVFHRDRYTCVYCGDTARQADHVIPRSRGGQDSQSNLVASCQTCNHSKHANDMLTWYRQQSFFNEERLGYILSITKDG